MSSTSFWIGIDVCKKWLDLHLRPTGKAWRVSNDAVGLALLATELPPTAQVAGIVVESTGGYEREVALDLAALGYPVSIINARQARNFAFLECPQGYELPTNSLKLTKSMLNFWPGSVKRCVRPCEPWPAKPSSNCKNW